MRVKKKTENVYTVTPFGKFMRYLRCKTGETPTKMAENLGISRGYLTVMELGVNNSLVPLYIIERVNNQYYLSDDEMKTLRDAANCANKNMHALTLSNISDEKKQKILDYAYDLILNNKETCND